MTKRTISATNEAETLKRYVKVVFFVRLDFSSGVKRFHSEIGPKTATHPVYGAEVYDGIGTFGGIVGDVKESISGAPIAMQLGLSGVDATLVNTAFTDNYYRRSAELMIGIEDNDGDLVDDPEILFSGYMDKIDIALAKHTANMQLNLESRATLFQRASDLRVTDEDLQAENTGDLMFEYVYQMSDLILRWGGQNTSFGRGGGTPTLPRTRVR